VGLLTVVIKVIPEPCHIDACEPPSAFLIDEQGIIGSSGIAKSRQDLNFVLSGAGK
jgi:hypothetical protein